jgi:hypothetical protein
MLPFGQETIPADWLHLMPTEHYPRQPLYRTSRASEDGPWARGAEVVQATLFGRSTTSRPRVQISEPKRFSIAWALLSPAVNPAEVGSLVYDSERNVVLYLSRDRVGDGKAVAVILLWDRNTWTEQQSPLAPPARESPRMVYDEARKQVVLFGGLHNGVILSGTRQTAIASMSFGTE